LSQVTTTTLPARKPIRPTQGVSFIAHEKEVRRMNDRDIRPVEDDSNAEYRSTTGAILTGIAAGATTETINALKNLKGKKK
jgi:hypothetical protein